MATITKVNGQNVLLDKFDSFGAMLAYAGGNPSKRSSDTGSPKFTLTKNYAEANKLATEGWHAVRPEVERLLTALQERIDNRLDLVSEVQYDTSGGAVDVGRWLTGEPECMFNFVPVPNERMGRVVKVFIDYGASAAYSAEFIRERGVVLCALVDTLQKMRIGCELWGETAVEYGGHPTHVHSTVVKLHDASTQLDIDELMFALANPSMLRRITFSVRELAGVGENHGYGRTTETVYAVEYGADIRIERLKERYSTMMENPVEWVVSTIKGLGLI